jgi:ABC-type amino acid transport substrate-binding protein
VGFVVDLEPFVIKEWSGIFPDLMREALKRLGHTMEPFQFPSRRFDFDPLGQFADLDLFVGTPVSHRADNFYAALYEFSNVAVSLSASRLDIRSVDDLRGKDIVAFNNAGLHLKQPFTALYERELKNSPLYHEVENQHAQFRMLLEGRTQVILLDRTMVRYRASQFGVQDMKGLKLHEIFPATNTVYAVGRDAEFIRRLEESFKAMHRDGSFRKVLAAYE